MGSTGGDGRAGDFLYNSQLDAFTLYHVIQEESGRHIAASGPTLPAVGHALAGSLATAASKLLIYPLDLVITRLQVQRQLHGSNEAPSAAKDADAEYAGLIDAAKKIFYGERGLAGFYVGCAPDVAKGIADSFLFFLAYELVRKHELRKVSGGTQLSIPKELGVGVAAGAFAKLITTPLQNIITRQQTAALIVAREPAAPGVSGQAKEPGIRAIARQILDERGIQGFWAGYSASLILTLNPAITFAVDNSIHRLLPKSQREKPRPALTFLIAAISKVLATTVTYPVSLAKSRAQVQSPTQISATEGTEKTDDQAQISTASLSASRSRTTAIKQNLHKYLRVLSAQYAIWLSLRKIYREEGIEGLYSGLEAEVLKGFLSHGLTMMTKGRVHLGVIQAYYALLRLSRRWPEDLKKVEGKTSEAVKDVQERVREGAEKVSEQGKKALGVEGG